MAILSSLSTRRLSVIGLFLLVATLTLYFFAPNSAFVSNLMYEAGIHAVIVEDPSFARNGAESKAINEINKAANRSFRAKEGTNVQKQADADLQLAAKILQQVQTQTNAGQELSSTDYIDIKKELIAANPPPVVLPPTGAYTGTGGKSCPGSSKDTTYPDGKWIPTTGNLSDGAGKACIQCQNGRWDNADPAACHEKYAEDPTLVILPPNASSEYTLGTAGAEAVGGANVNTKIFAYCKQGTDALPTGDQNSNGDYCYNGRWVDSTTFQDNMKSHCESAGLVFSANRCQPAAPLSPSEPDTPAAPPKDISDTNFNPDTALADKKNAAGTLVSSPSRCESGLAEPVPGSTGLGSYRCLPPEEFIPNSNPITPPSSLLTQAGAARCSGTNLLKYTVTAGAGKWITDEVCSYGCDTSANACLPKPEVETAAKVGDVVTSKSKCPYGYRTITAPTAAGRPSTSYQCSKAGVGTHVVSEADCESGRATRQSYPPDPFHTFKCDPEIYPSQEPPPAENPVLSLIKPTCSEIKEEKCALRGQICSPTLTGGSCKVVPASQRPGGQGGSSGDFTFPPGLITLPTDINMWQAGQEGQFSKYFEIITNVVGGCQAGGSFKGTDLRNCFCEHINCNTENGNYLATYYEQNSDDGDLDLQCAEFTLGGIDAMLSSNPLLRGTDASGFDQQMLGKTPNGWYFCDNLTSFIKDDIAIWKGPPGHVAVIVEADESSTGTAASANYHNDRAASFDTVSVDSVKGVWRRVPDSQREEKVKGCWETNHSRVL